MAEVTILFDTQQSPAHQMENVLSTVLVTFLVKALSSHVRVEATVCLISMGTATIMIILEGTQPFHARRTVPAVSPVVADIHPTTANATALASPAPQRVGTVV